MEGAKRTCEDELETMQNKRPRKPRTTEAMVATAWKSLSNPDFDGRSMTFCYGAFEATVRWISTTSTLDLNFRILKEKGNETASSVVSQLIELMDAFVSKSETYSTCLVRVVSYTQFREAAFKSLDTVVFPETWVCLQSCRAVVFQRGALDIQLEVRAVDMRENPPKLNHNDVWHGYVRVPRNTATVLDLKDRIDELKSKGIKFLDERPIAGCSFAYQMERSRMLPLHPTFQVMELRPYNYRSAATFTEGSTEWMSLVKDAKLGCHENCGCHTSGTLRFLAYVDDENMETPLM